MMPASRPSLALRRPSPAVAAGAIVLLLASALYLRTLENSLRLSELKGGDPITHQYAQVEGRPSNAPGYPLYTMGGWLWFHGARLLLGHLAPPTALLSSYSTLWGLAALALLYVLALRLTNGSWAIAAATSLFYACTYFFWYYSVSVEQYTSAVFQTLLLLLLALTWQRNRDERLLGWLAFVGGTCLANLVTVLLIGPALLWFVLSQYPALLKRRGLLLRLTGLALLPLLSYTYVYVRGAQHPEWRGQGQWHSTLSWFLDFISTRQGRHEMTTQVLPINFAYLKLVPDELTWPILIAGLAGLAQLERHQAGLAYGTLVAYLLFSYVDRNGNWFQVVMPAYAIIVLGAAKLAHSLSSRARHRREAAAVLSALLVIAAGERLAANWPRADLRDRPNADALCPGLPVAQDLETQSITTGRIVTTTDEAYSLQYIQTMYGYARGPVAVAPGRQAAGADLVSREAVFLLDTTALLPRPQAVGQVLLGRDLDLGPSLQPQATLGPLAVAILDVQRRAQPAACGGDQLVVLLRWDVLKAPATDFIVSARPTVGGQRLYLSQKLVQDDHAPLWGLVPTASWRAGQAWQDSFTFRLPASLTPDSLELIAYEGTGVLWTTSVSLPLPRQVSALGG